MALLILFLSKKPVMPTTVASIRLEIAIATMITMEILDVREIDFFDD